MIVLIHVPFCDLANTESAFDHLRLNASFLGELDSESRALYLLKPDHIGCIGSMISL